MAASNKDQKTSAVPANTPMTQAPVSLDNVLLNFQKNFQSDPLKLLQAFPATEVWRHMVEFPVQDNTKFKKENSTLIEAIALSKSYETTHPEVKNDIAQLKNKFSKEYDEFFSSELKNAYLTEENEGKQEEIYNELISQFDAVTNQLTEEVGSYYESKKLDSLNPELLHFVIDYHDYELPLKEFIKKHPHYLGLLAHPWGHMTGTDLMVENDLTPFENISLNDFIQMHCGWNAFEGDEPGYLKGTLNAYQHWTDLFKTKKPKLSSELVKSIHLAAAEQVEQTKYANDLEKPGKFRQVVHADLFDGTSYCTTYRLDFLNSSPQGFKELVNKINKKNFPILFFLANPSDENDLEGVDPADLDENFYHQYANNEDKEIRLIVCIPKGEKIESFLNKKMDESLAQFEKEMAEAKTPRDKLRAIINFIQDCEQIHFFADLNCRTFCMNLLNFLLLNHGFPTAILHDPNWFDGFSVDELIEETIQGMDRTLRVASGEQIFEVPTKTILQCMTDEQKKYFEEAVQIINPQFNLAQYLSGEMKVYSDAKHHVLFAEAGKKNSTTEPPTLPQPPQND